MPHYLIRHAQAAEADDDRLRPLSAEGRRQVGALCAALGPGFQPAEIWRSPLVRACETAELLAAGLGLRVPVIEKAGLEPEQNPRAVAALLEAEKRDIAVVGHEPNLGLLATFLIHGPVRVPILGFAKGGTLSLRREGRGWTPEWLVRAP